MREKIHLILVIFCVLCTGCTGMDLLTRIITFIKITWEILKMSIPKSKDQLLGSTQTILYQTSTRLGVEAFNQFCSQAINAHNYSSISRTEKDKPDFGQIRIIFYNNMDNASYHVSDMSNLVNHTLFDKDAPTVIFVSGWLTNLLVNEGAIALYEAYKCRGNNNFLVVDPHAAIQTLYIWSVLNGEELAEFLSPAIVELTKFIDLKNLHIIGHSLGAQIAGSIGRNYQKLTNKTLPRITGLDPAYPCFDHEGEMWGLDKTAAELVDVIHSNSGAMGVKEPIGDVDFYPNGEVITMPGCISLSCSHHRSFEYFAESVYPGNEYNFVASKCSSFQAYKYNSCNDEATIPMGYATPLTAEGSYYLETHSEPPFGMNSTEVENKCSV